MPARHRHFLAFSRTPNRYFVSRKVGIVMPNSNSVDSIQPIAAATPDCFRRRLAICFVQTVFNAIIVARSAGTLYRVTTHNALQQVGVTLLFAVLLGSLARMWFLTLKSRTR
jgi:hypothetical protein